MYSNCIFCNRPFGSNAAIETLPVGRRIAFDAQKGRLWVVCRRCERWNLAPLEERWEPIEEAERLFRDTRVRVSTEHIGLARLAEGTELVRIGRPLRPEFAAWRYGDQFGRRRRRMVAVGAGAAVVVGSVFTAGLMTGILSGAMVAQSGNFLSYWMNGRTVLRLPAPDGTAMKLKRRDLADAHLAWYDNGWYVRVARAGSKADPVWFTGVEAQRAASLLLPRLNASGASQRAVQESVQELERAGGPTEFITRLIIEHPPVPSWQRTRYRPEEGVALGALSRPQRLALEMALHEEHERRALAGEIKGLELAWQAAEDVAAIADDLLLPDRVRDGLEGRTRRD
jgi:hypothetical protein